MTIGFEVHFEVPDAATGDKADAWWDMIIDAVESRGLAVCGGSVAGMWDVAVVTLDGESDVTAAQRDSLIAWLKAPPTVRNLTVGPLKDLDADAT